MIRSYNNILNEEDIFFLKNYIISLNLPISKNMALSTNGTSTKCGMLGAKVAPIFEKLTSYIKKDYGDEYYPTTAWGRVYTNGSKLDPHIDVNIGLTMTVGVYSNTDKIWPLYVSEKVLQVEEQVDWEKLAYSSTYNPNIDPYFLSGKKFMLAPGDAVACLGRGNPHWRLPLECNNNQRVLQAFFHWRKD